MDRQQESGPESQPGKETNTEEAVLPGVRMEIELPQVPGKPDPLLAIVKLSNDSSDTLNYTENGFHETLDIQVHDLDGKRVEMTAAGDMKMNGRLESGRVIIDSSVNREVAPNHSVTFRIPIRDYFLLKPGEHTIRVSLNIFMDGINAGRHRISSMPKRFETTSFTVDSQNRHMSTDDIIIVPPDLSQGPSTP